MSQHHDLGDADKQLLSLSCKAECAKDLFNLLSCISSGKVRLAATRVVCARV